MQPTQQNVIPVTLFAGYSPSSGWTVDLDSNYDHVLCCIVAQVYAGGADDYLEIDDQDGNYVWSANLPAPNDVGPVPIYWAGAIVLQSAAELQMTDYSANAQWQVSAYRLNPSATILFS